MSSLASIEKKVLSNISVEKTYEHVQNIVSIGQKLAGSAEEIKFVEYISKVLENYNVDYVVHEFPGYVSHPKSGEVRVTYPETREISCSVFAQIASTPPDGIESEVAYVGAGGLDDYKNVEVKGKITLADLSYSPPRPEKVRIAQDAGAIGQIQINWGLPEKNVLPLGTVKSIWGNPLPEDRDRLCKLPVVGITKKDGLRLKELCQKSKVRIWMKAEAWRGFLKLHLPVATVKGAEEPERFVLMAGHYDCWGPGATDNATGNATLLELARIFEENKKQLKRSVKLAWWPGHESGIMAGSTWYVDNFWHELDRGCVGYLICDSLGMAGTVDMISASSTEDFVQAIASVTKDLYGESIEPSRLIKTGDQSALGMGIPSMTMRTTFPDDVVIREVGRKSSYLGWWYHSVEDTLDKVDIARLEKTIRTYALLTLRLTNSALLPFDHTRSFDILRNTIQELSNKTGDKLDLTMITSRLPMLEKELRRLKRASASKSLKGNEKLNLTLIRLSRIFIPIMYTYDRGRYGQDPYGLTYQRYPIPSLQPINQLAEINEDSDEFKMWQTKLRRRVNEIADELEHAIDLLTND